MKAVKRSLVGLLLLSQISLVAGCTTSARADGGFDESQGLVVSGTVEVDEVDLNSKLPGRIAEILVKEGDQVKAGTVLLRMESEELKAKEAQAIALVDAAKAAWEQANRAVELQEQVTSSQVKQANGALAAAQSQYDKAKNGTRSQDLNKAQIQYDLMKQTYDRVERLYQKGAVPAQKRDEVKAQLDVAAETLSMAKEGARSEDVAAAQALVNQAGGAVAAANAARMQVELAREQATAAEAKYKQALGGLDEVRAYLKDTELKAPVDGTVTALNVDVKELVSTGLPLLTVANDNAWVEVKVRETDLNKITEGREVRVKVPGLGDQVLRGKVAKIAKKPDFATKRATNDKGEQDILAFGVKVSIDAQQPELRPGMTAFVQFGSK